MTFILFIANCRNGKQVRGREGESVWGGAAGGWGKCGRGTRVCAQMNHSSMWCATGLSGRESKSWGKIWVSSTSYQTLTATLLHSTRFLLCLSFLFSYSFALFYSDTHPHAQTHTHTNRHSWLKEDGTTGELLNTFTATHPAHQQSQCPGCGRLSWGSCWDYWPPPGQKFKVRRLCLFPVDFALYGDLFFLFCLNCTGLSGSRSFWKDFNQTLLLLCGKRHHLKERDSALLLVECMCRCRRDSVSNTSTDSLAVRDSW